MYLLDFIVCFVKITSQISKQLQHIPKTRLHKKKRRVYKVLERYLIFLSSCLSEEMQTVKHHWDLLLCSSILPLWLACTTIMSEIAHALKLSPATRHEPQEVQPLQWATTVTLVSYTLVPSSWRPAHHLHHWGQQTHPPPPPHQAEGFQRSTYF